MSLAIYAAPFNENSNNIDNSINNDIIHEKRQHNKTQKNYYRENFKTNKENFDQNKVNSVLKEIHNTTDEDDDDRDTFNPPPKPESMGVFKTTPPKESFVSPLGRTVGRAPSPNYEGGDDLDLNDYSNYGDSKTIEEYYKSVIPGYKPQRNYVNRPYYPSQNSETNNSYQSPDVLMQKLNYVISLLEDQQDEKTNHVTEEVILYSFLGIFIIFIADTFVKAGKYTR